jgi:methyltransferase
MLFSLFIAFIIILRLTELVIAKRNEKWLLQNGAIEYGKKHYPFIVLLHVSFLISLILEYLLCNIALFSLPIFFFYLLVLAIKVWVVSTLGQYWNTKIYHIPNTPLVKKGLYKYCKHPNYIIVIIEIVLIPLVFHLYYTAIIFTVLNLVMLFVRIKEENKALKL